MTSLTVNGQPMDAGCWVDGHLGQYAAREVVRIADEILGTDIGGRWPTDEEGADLGTYGALGTPWADFMGDDTVGAMVDLTDEAEATLNAATDGGVWYWEDGEFFLHPLCSAPTDDGGECGGIVWADGCEECGA